MRGERDLFAEKPVVEHQDGTVEELELVIPEQMKNSRLRRRRIANESDIVLQHSRDFAQRSGFGTLITAQIEKSDVRIAPQLRHIQVVAADEVYVYPRFG